MPTINAVCGRSHCVTISHGWNIAPNRMSRSFILSLGPRPRHRLCQEKLLASRGSSRCRGVVMEDFPRTRRWQKPAFHVPMDTMQYPGIQTEYIIVMISTKTHKYERVRTDRTTLHPARLRPRSGSVRHACAVEAFNRRCRSIILSH